MIQLPGTNYFNTAAEAQAAVLPPVPPPPSQPLPTGTNAYTGSAYGVSQSPVAGTPDYGAQTPQNSYDQEYWALRDPAKGTYNPASSQPWGRPSDYVAAGPSMAGGYYQDPSGKYWVEGQSSGPAGVPESMIIRDTNQNKVPDDQEIMTGLYGGLMYGGERFKSDDKVGLDNSTIMGLIDKYGADWKQSPEYTRAKMEYGMSTGSNSVGGVSTVNPQADDFDFAQVDRFQQQAYEQAMRSLDQQLQQQNARFAQDLINRGIDPNSEAGKTALANMQMGQNDLLSKAKFDALGFGASLQDQMFGQDLSRSQLANALQQLQMQIDSQEGMQANQIKSTEGMFGKTLGQQESEFARNLAQGDYQFGSSMNQRGHEFDTTMGMAADQQAWNQMMGLEDLNYRDAQAATDDQRYRDTIAMWLMSMAPQATYGGSATGLPQAAVADYTNQAADARAMMQGGGGGGGGGSIFDTIGGMLGGLF